MMGKLWARCRRSLQSARQRTLAQNNGNMVLLLAAALLLISLLTAPAAWTAVAILGLFLALLLLNAC